MTAKDIFAGPIVRRAEPGRVVIWLATKKAFDFVFSIREQGKTDWLAHDTKPEGIEVFPKLHVYLATVKPQKGQKFPTNKLLEYSIAVKENDFENEEYFAKIVKDDKLAYPKFSLPTFFLQSPGQKLNALYVSCRKIHDKDAGADDAMAAGDDFIFNNADVLSVRPAVLCLTGDQIYADDVHDVAFDEMRTIATVLTKGVDETLPVGLTAPGKGKRQDFLSKNAAFTSGSMKNHLISLAEYAAMYGLAWSPHNWSSSGSYPDEVRGYVEGLPKVRRLLANTPTYMIFDDHEITDDWNLSVDWSNNVRGHYLGKRIIANGLYAYWLFQDWGNEPARYQKFLSDIKDLNANRTDKPGQLENFFWGWSDWEFVTPTLPFIYFLDTRTQRGHSDGRHQKNSGPPAYLKKVEAWQRTALWLNAIAKSQGSSYPVVIVAPGPVFGFETIDALQGKWGPRVVGPYPFDNESWAANMRHLLLFLTLCYDYNVVILSGDVHFAYTSTARFANFDDEFFRAVQAAFPKLTFPKTGSGASPSYQFLYSSSFIQLTSSAAKNSNPSVLKIASSLTSQYAFVLNNKGGVTKGMYKDGLLWIETLLGLKVVKVEDHQPSCLLYQRYNDAYNTPYTVEHNIGLLTIDKKQVANALLTKKGKTAAKSWDFSNKVYWEG